jgi:SAM-dependent methyltransferase
VKRYDEAYFSRWYRSQRDRVATPDSLARKIRMAIAVAEFQLGRPIRSVVDVGCGEAPWFPILRQLRHGVSYVGVDSSEYVLRRFGKRRNIRQGTVGTLAELRLPKKVDLVVCADVLQYVPTRDVERGLAAIRRILGGVAYIEAFTIEDGMAGDLVDWHERTAEEYRRLFRRAGLAQCGPYCFIDPDRHDSLNSFERV